jgi:hypothetical protein
MGTLCAKTGINIQQVGTVGTVGSGVSSGAVNSEPEIQIPTYVSESDQEFSKLEGKFNFFSEISLNDYIYSLSKFSNENATLEDDYTKKPPSYSSNEAFYSEPFPSDIMQSFIENKLFKHPNLYTKAGENQTNASIFKDMVANLHKNIENKMNQYDKEQGNEQTAFTKGIAITFGILYCSGQNVSKIKVLYDLFSENGKFGKSDKWNRFVLGLFLLPSYAMLSARNKLASYEEVGEFPKDVLKKLFDTNELKDCVNLVTVLNKQLFGEDNRTYTYDRFKALFQKGDKTIGWMLTPKGIRKFLQDNNV